MTLQKTHWYITLAHFYVKVFSVERLRAWLWYASNSRVLRVAFFGAIGVVVQTIVFETVGIGLHLLRPSLATLLGAECGVLTSFVLNNRFSFEAASSASLPLRLLRFHVVVSGSLFIQWLSVFLAESLFTSVLLLHIAYVLGIALGFISNYTGYRLFVWKQSDATFH